MERINSPCIIYELERQTRRQPGVTMKIEGRSTPMEVDTGAGVRSYLQGAVRHCTLLWGSHSCNRECECECGLLVSDSHTAIKGMAQAC